ncbi:uncharacterized protein LOC100906306 [Galendromus occidentalis]|uniref:Uncharacterized protein LOC100906306 n=1 Tax=Galendromus occidentalis TaxID=34638 RepID=A0AAJ6QT26_9ACAR|nr:uncharacterized protein LOC100906306 [Galendromus occidentalis]
MDHLKFEVFPFRAHFNVSEKFLRLAIVQLDPFINKKRGRGFVEVYGAFSQAAFAIQAITKHRLSIVSVEDAPHGIKLKNGTFLGIMGMFQRGEIDVFMGPALQNNDRFPIVESSTVSVSTYNLLTWSPRKMIDPFNFVLAFDADVWAVLIISFVSLVIFSWTVDRYLTPWRTEPKLPVTFYIWEFFTYFFPQCSGTQQARWFRMCQMGFWIGFSLLLMTSLSGALTSTMTIKGEEDSVKKYADILRFPEVQIFAEGQSWFTQIFTHPQNELYRKLSSRLRPVRGLFRDRAKARQAVVATEARRGVIVGSPTICKSFILKEKKASGRCPRVTISSGNAGLMSGSILISRKLPRALRSLINKGVLASTEAFLHQQYVKWTLRDVEECLRNPDVDDKRSTRGLSIPDLQGSFILLSIGLSVALGTFAIERILEQSG